MQRMHEVLNEIPATLLVGLCLGASFLVAWQVGMLFLVLTGLFLWHKARYCVTTSILHPSTNEVGTCACGAVTWGAIPVGSLSLESSSESNIPDDTMLDDVEWKAKIDAVLHEVAQKHSS